MQLDVMLRRNEDISFLVASQCDAAQRRSKALVNDAS